MKSRKKFELPTKVTSFILNERIFLVLTNLHLTIKLTCRFGAQRKSGQVQRQVSQPNSCNMTIVVTCGTFSESQALG